MTDIKSKKVIALEARLKGCQNVITLGVRPNFSDYSHKEAELIRKADKIYYPTSFYADILGAMGKPIFPSGHTYKFVQDKIKQTAIFDLLKLPHPKTRVFYGKRQKMKIFDYFKFPFIGKVPRGSAMGRGVFLIKNRNDFDEYLGLTNIAYIQEYMPVDHDYRVVVVGSRVLTAYRRIAPPGDFRSNVSVGGRVSFEKIPSEVSEFALYIAAKCGWEDVGIDIIKYKGRLYVLEANMKYGKEGFRAAGIDYLKLMEEMIENEEI